MRVCHGFGAVFDDPNLVSCAGLAPVMHLAERAGLPALVAEHVRIDKPGGNAQLKVPALVAGGVVGGADSIEDMALLRHGELTGGGSPLVQVRQRDRSGSHCQRPALHGDADGHELVRRSYQGSTDRDPFSYAVQAWRVVQGAACTRAGREHDWPPRTAWLATRWRNRPATALEENARVAGDGTGDARPVT